MRGIYRNARSQWLMIAGGSGARRGLRDGDRRN